MQQDQTAPDTAHTLSGRFVDAALEHRFVTGERTARVVHESSEMGELYHISDAAQMRQAFHDRNIARSRNEWLYPYDPLHVAIP